MENFRVVKFSWICPKIMRINFRGFHYVNIRENKNCVCTAKVTTRQLTDRQLTESQLADKNWQTKKYSPTRQLIDKDKSPTRQLTDKTLLYFFTKVNTTSIIPKARVVQRERRKHMQKAPSSISEIDLSGQWSLTNTGESWIIYDSNNDNDYLCLKMLSFGVSFSLFLNLFSLLCWNINRQ